MYFQLDLRGTERAFPVSPVFPVAVLPVVSAFPEVSAMRIKKA
jgi:hypothetical protein